VTEARADGRPAVLLVEDEAEIVGLMRDFLEAEGFEVHAAASGSAAIAALSRSRVDCVLLDVMLQGESGFDVCRRLRDRSGVPILFLSARGEDSDKIRGLRLRSAYKRIRCADAPNEGTAGSARGCPRVTGVYVLDKREPTFAGIFIKPASGLGLCSLTGT
jgi:CheY-like chemotaxis protein